MMFMTAKVNPKKLLLVLGAVAAGILALVLLLQPSDAPEQPAALTGNEARLAFLESRGWKVIPTPEQSGMVRIPREPTRVFEKYNDLQKSQGYDLNRYAGKQVMRYVYTVTNLPGATEPVYATLLTYEGQVIGGDITDTGAQGRIRGLGQETLPPESPTEAPTEAPSEPEKPEAAA